MLRVLVFKGKELSYFLRDDLPPPPKVWKVGVALQTQGHTGNLSRVRRHWERGPPSVWGKISSFVHWGQVTGSACMCYLKCKLWMTYMICYSNGFKWHILCVTKTQTLNDIYNMLLKRQVLSDIYHVSLKMQILNDIYYILLKRQVLSDIYYVSLKMWTLNAIYNMLLKRKVLSGIYYVSLKTQILNDIYNMLLKWRF